MHRNLFVIVLAVLLCVSTEAQKPKQRDVKVQKSSLSREQEIDLG